MTYAPDVGLNFSRKTGAVRKQILRNVNVPIYKQPIIENHSRYPFTFKDFDENINDNSSTKYRHPELQSTLGLVKRYEQFKSNTKMKQLKSLDDLTPKSKAMVREKLTMKLNVHPNKQIFTKLIPINVNDTMLELDTRKQKKRKPFRYKPNEKDPEPELSDYLDPIEPLSFVQDILADRPKCKPCQQRYRDMWNEVRDWYEDLSSIRHRSFK